VELNSLRRAGLILSLWDASQAEGLSFTDKLKQLHGSGLPQIIAGRIIIGTSRAGHSVSFDAAGMTNADVFDQITRLRLDYTRANTRLIAAGNAAPSDEQIKDELLGEAQVPVTEYSTDFSTLVRGGRLVAA
jgi:hypothetical protein